MYIDKLDDIVNEYNNTYHRAIKMKPVDAKDNTYTNFGKDVNDKNPKFKIQEKVRIEKVIRKKGNKLYLKWKGYDSSFNSWICKKDVVSK